MSPLTPGGPGGPAGPGGPWIYFTCDDDSAIPVRSVSPLFPGSPFSP